MFERDVAMAKAQDDRHWQVDAKVSTGADGAALLDITARDATGAPLAGLSATALFARPTDRRLDRAVTVSEDTSGHFHGSADGRSPANGTSSSSCRARASELFRSQEPRYDRD